NSRLDENDLDLKKECGFKAAADNVTAMNYHERLYGGGPAAQHLDMAFIRTPVVFGPGGIISP
ncbi:hypothetical protein FRC11_000121, partial [Ceratobasidium sp. 423]